MADQQNDSDVARLNAVLAADPVYQQLLQQPHGSRLSLDATAKLNNRAAELGVKAQIPSGYDIDPGSGQVVEYHGIRNALLTNAAVLGAGFGGLALAPGAAASAGGAGASAALPSTAAATTGSSLLPKLLNVGSQIAAPLASMEAGRAAGRTAEDAANQTYDRNNINRSIAADDNYQRNVGNALRGGLLQGTQDSTITAPAGIRMGTVTGGLRPSAILGKEDIGKQLQTQATKNLLASDQSGDTTTPALTPRPSSNGFDTALNVAAPILSLADLLKPKNYNTLPVPPTAQGTSKTTFGLPPGLQLLPPRSSY